MSCFSVNGTGSFTLKLDESFVTVKTIFGSRYFCTGKNDIWFYLFGSDHLSCFSKDITIKQPFSPAYGKMSVHLLVSQFSFSFLP